MSVYEKRHYRHLGVNSTMVVFVDNLDNSMYSAHLVDKPIVSFPSFTARTTAYEKNFIKYAAKVANISIVI